MIAKTIDNAVDLINRKFSGLKTEASIIRNTELYDLNVGKVVNSSTEEAISGFIDSFNFNEIDDVKVLQDDLKFILISSTEIRLDSVKDQIKIGLFSYIIRNVRKYSVGNKNVVYVLQLRL